MRKVKEGNVIFLIPKQPDTMDLIGVDGKRITIQN
ncbi:hypothetical protein TEMA_09650 [Terrisporobacter mayombei]|uniref:Uncharacterized protein n=1 Tax=Terrisporobacter mayombei TaxID=1541 RepID=A0ABY9PZP0_9FIRM|nr:hypothetical protein TEMA_09650 [Terrisporobacter mayombei]